MSETLTRRSLLASVVFAAAFGGCAFGAAIDEVQRRRLVRIPPRPPGAITGSAFANGTAKLSDVERQRRAAAELLSGNVPEFLRTLVPVGLGAAGLRRRQAARQPGEHAAWIWVLPDYLAIGSDEDYLRMPLSLPRALEICRAWDMFLPTRKMVDAVYAQAEVKLKPQPMPPGPRMRSSEYFLRHQKMIEASRGNRPLGALTAGHKKDIVLSKRLLRQPDRIAIYGWHRSIEDAIQPLSTVHGARYADYSHGVRLVDSTVLYDGAERRLDTLLVDAATAGIFSFEGGLPRQLVLKRS
jgi:hypothetical protein